MRVLASNNIASGVWSFDASPEAPITNIQIGFNIDGYAVPSFDNLKFGYSVTVNGVPSEPVEYPPPGARYISSDQEYISSDPVALSCDDEVSLFVWSENAGIRSEDSTEFTVPRPPSPYPSWVWQGSYWTSPVPHPGGEPEPGVYYVWNEESQSWDRVESEEI